ncbi:axoneme-associated protein mst101(2) isoform X1 [Takifugu rubripes]|uniref:axoneme-associated protein mst101(2) isoform X1 n=2 Tax=Takifugu rubripes TaxID=31033 RepID=UPI00114551C9|nr:axoneme-associated protein mst101(2)-like isoform X1 [Takifugu rubripes]
MYSTLKRPKRKLCYISDKKCSSEQWADKMSLVDIDKIFDDLEPSSHDEDDDLVCAPLLHISNTTSGTEEAVSPVLQQKGPRIKELPKVSPEQCVSPKPRPLSPELDIGLNCPFKAHRPVKTSSPIEKKSVANCTEEVHNKEGVMSPVLFPCEDNMDNGCNESDFESPPQKVTLNKCKMTIDKHAPPISGQKRRGSPASAARRQTGAKMPEKKPEPVHGQTSSRAEKDMTTFLQKLRDAAQPKPSRSRKSLTPVKVSSPPVLEDDFLILEDDEAFRISIPSTTNKRYRRTSSRDKESPADKGAKGSSAVKQPQTDQVNNKLEPQTVGPKVKKKGRDMIASREKNEVTPRGNEVDVPENVPSCDLNEPQKSSQRKWPKEGPSKDSDKAKEQPQTGRRASGGRGKPAEKKETRQEKSKYMKTVTDDSEATIHKSSKVTQKAAQDLVCDDATMAEDNKITLEAKLKKKHQRGKLPAVSEESSSGDSPIQKRKRRQPGEWWVSSCQREDTDVSDRQPTPKKAKQNKKEPKMSLNSPENGKDRVEKKRIRKQPAQPSLPKPKTQPLKNGNKEKGEKQKNNLNLKGCAPGRRKLFDEVEAEQVEQQEVVDQDLGPVQSSPLILRDHSLNPSKKSQSVFHKVYQHGSSEKKSRPAVDSPEKSEEQPGPGKRERRRREPTGNWWMVKESSDDVESGSLQPQRQEVKRRKERKKQPKRIKSPGLKTPQNNSLPISPIPPEGAPTPHLRAKPASAPKTIKRSLATFKDIFTSTSETPADRGRSDAALNSGPVVGSGPSVVTECSAGEDNTATVISMDARDFKSSNNQEPAENSTNQSDNMLKSLRSGPTCMIELQQYEENDETNLPSSRFEAVLSASDLCGPPLKPLTLQPKDKANLSLWFKSLWSVAADRGPDITPDDFDWYFYKGRAVGIQEDLTCNSICNGKLLLGSFMKKPLWVDHNANTVFNLLTSSVKVSVNGRESHFTPAQSFMVHSGEAYSVQNLTMQPAVLYFTRIFAESSD